MNRENFSKIVSLFNIAAIKAGEKIMENYKSSNYKVKHDGSPITIADLEANKVITEILSSKIADIKIVSEENEELNDSEKYFLINYILIDEDLEDIKIINENLIVMR